MLTKSILAALLLVLPGLSNAKEAIGSRRSTKPNDTNTRQLPLSIEANGTIPGKLIGDRGFLAEMSKVMGEQAAKSKHAPTPKQQAAVEALGFSLGASTTIRAFMNAAADEQTDAKNADIGMAFVRHGNDFNLEGHVDLMKLAATGQFSRNFAKFLVYHGHMKAADMTHVVALLAQSTKVNMNAQMSLLEMADDSLAVVGKLGLDSLGTFADIDADEYWQNLWNANRRTIAATLDNVGSFIDAHNQVVWNVTCNPSACDVRVSGNASEADAGAFLKELWFDVAERLKD